jgi:hypothetical protein
VINVIDKELERHEIEALLPWHAAGTLSRREADFVEPALADDSELARLYDLVLQELAETIHLNETLGAPSARSWRSCSPQSTLRGVRAPHRRRPRSSERLHWRRSAP